MKSIVFFVLISSSSIALAQGTGHEGHAAPAATESAAVTGNEAAAPAKKMTRKQAKSECKSEGKKGKALKECVREKIQN